MRLGSRIEMFSSFGEKRYKKMKVCGHDCADIKISGEIGDLSEEEYRLSALTEKKSADEAGITIWQTHGPWCFPPHDETEEHRAERFGVMQRSIRLTAEIGCKYWVIHPLMPFGPNDDFDLDEFYKINYDFFKALLPTAKENGVTICFENMPMKALTISTPEKSLEFIRKIDDENFKFCIDTGHSMVFGIQPADAVRMAGKDLKVLHVHDNHGSKDEHLIPYQGVVDWKDFRHALDEVGLTDITVSGWFFTHAYGDHVGGVKIFFQKYGDKVNVKNVFFNPTTSDEGTACTASYSTTEKNIVVAINKYSSNTKVTPLHTGQYFWLADVKVEVLYTVEDLKQGIFDNYNDCSTVTRLTINGKKVLMVGDSATRAWTLIVPRYGSELKSDYLQVPHHGVQPGGTISAYKAIQPDYLFWPAGQALYEKALKNDASKYLRGTVADDHVYIAGSLGNVTKITFS